MTYDDFVLQLDPVRVSELRVRVLESPAGQASTELALEEAFLELSDLLAAAARETADLARGGSRNLVLADALDDLPSLGPAEIGTVLCDHLFSGPVRRLFDQSLGSLRSSTDRGLRIKLKLDPQDPRAARLAALPWELLFRAETEDFLALSRKTPLVRYLDVPRPCQPIRVAGPLRVLAAIAGPRDLPALDLEAEKRKLASLTREQGSIHLTFLEHASTAAVRERLIEGGYHVLHFMGHGDFDPASAEGLVHFEGEDGSSEPVSGRALAIKLKDLSDLGLVVLNACNTAQAAHGGGASPFGGVAGALVLGGVPAVLAMQMPIPDRAAIHFSQAFYRRLAAGDPVDGAVTEGRQAIHSVAPDSIAWAIPVLFTRVADGNVFEEVSAPSQAPAPAPAVPVPALLASEPETERRIGKKLAGTLAALLAVVVLVVVLQVGPWFPTKPKDSPVETQLDKGPDSTKPAAGQGTGNPSEPRPEQKKPEPAPRVPPSEAAAPVPEPVSTSPEHLSCRCSSLSRREGKGLRASLSCTNSGPTPVEVTLEAFLSDDNSSSYSVVGSSLPAGARGPRLAVAAGATASFSLDFPLPKLGASEFFLELAAGSSTIPLEGSALSL